MLFETFLGRLMVKVTGVKYMSKWSYTCIELVRAIAWTIMNEFQINFAQFLSSRRKSAI